MRIDVTAALLVTSPADCHDALSLLSLCVQVIESTPSPSSGVSRVATPPVNTTPDIVTPASSGGGGVPSPADRDADTGLLAAKRPRLRSTKSELFLVNSEPSRDATDADGSCDVGGGRTVTSLVAAVSDDSVDSCSVADVSQNSVTDVSAEDAVRQAGVVTGHLSSADTSAAQVGACVLVLSFVQHALKI